MAVQLTRRQIIDAAINVDKLDLSAGTFDFTGATVQVATPSADSHAATKAYVDNLAQGLQWKDSVKVATVSNITLSGTQTIDNIAVSADDRVLVRDQTNKEDNGIYLVKSGSWERAKDMDAGDEFAGAAVFVQQGDTYADCGFVCTNDGSVTVGTTEIAFVQFTGAGQLSAGNALQITGSTIDVLYDGTSIGLTGGNLAIQTGGVSNDMLANSTISGVALGGSLYSLSASAAGAITMTSYDGSATVANVAVNVDNVGIQIASNALQLVDGGVTNTKLQYSTISGVALGSDLASLSNGNGIAVLSYNGGSSATVQIQLDGSTLALSGSGVKVASGGIGATELASNAVTNAKIENSSITVNKLNFTGFQSKLTASGSQSAFELSAPLSSDWFEFFAVSVNGLLMEYNASTSSKDEYYMDNNGTGGVARIVFGANLDSGDRVVIRGFVDQP